MLRITCLTVENDDTFFSGGAQKFSFIHSLLTMNQKTVVVRCATQNFQDFKVDVNSKWTVLDFKAFLAQNHASKPPIDKQKLIFAGQLMKNDQPISSYLSKSDDNFSPIIHLVCTPELNRSPTTTPLPKPQIRSQANIAQNASFQNQTSQPFVQSSPDLMNFQQQQGVVLHPHAMHFYQYYNQYLQYLQQIYGQGQGQVAWAPYGHHQEQTQRQMVQEAAAPAVNAVLNNEIPAAPGAAGVIEPEANNGAGRDFLDVVYMLLRSSIIFVVLFAYSSIERTIFVVAVVLLFFAYQNGWFARRNNDEQQQQPQEQRANNDDNNNRIRAAENANIAGGNPVDAPTENLDHPQSAWNVFWSTCYTFVSSFFSSLIPERPPPIDNF